MRVRSKGFAILAGTATVTVALLSGAIATAAAPAGPSAAADVLLSRNKPVVASSSGGCCPAPNAVDGNSATRWASRANIDPSWIYVDLGATVHVSRVRLQWDLSCATAYRIETSNDHATWTTINSTTNGNGGVDDLTVSGDGRYVRMFGTHRCRSDATHGYSLQEYDVFGNGDGEAPTPPGMPSLVSVTSGSATIKWGASTDNVGVTGYQIFRDGQECADVGGTTLQGTCTGLTPNQTYGFYVQAVDAAGNNSQPSPTLPVTTPPSNDNEPPTAPTNVHSTAVTSSSVTLAWTAATDNVGVKGYNVYNEGTTKVASTTGTNVRVDALAANTTFHFTVKAFDENQEGPASSPPLTVKTLGGGCTQPVCTPVQIATDNDVVWGLVTLPDGSILYNRRDAHNIMRLDPRTGTKTNVGTVPNVQSTDGEGGLTGLEISPTNFEPDRWLYIMHTSPNDNRIVRIKLNANFTLNTGSEQVLVSGIARNKFHDGGRLRFSPDGRFLFAGTGDAQNGANAQNRNSLNGKVLRIMADGRVPSDNPFGNAVWSMGHRNIQGLAFDSQGRLWEQEFGNSVMDETNLIVKGGNYGWPDCEGTSNHGGKGCGQPGFIAPKHTYSVASGSCSGITIIRDALYIACQRGTRLIRFVISGSSLTNMQTFFQGTFGRLRTVEPSPDGNMWMATSNGGDKDSTPNNSNNRIFRVPLGP